MKRKQAGPHPDMGHQKAGSRDPLVSEPSAAARKLAAAADDEGRIAIIAEIAADKDPSAVAVLADIYTSRSSSEEAAEAAHDAIAGMGGAALPALLALIRIAKDDFESRSLGELACRIAGAEVSGRLSAGAPGAMEDAIRLFADPGTDEGVADAVWRAIVGSAGVSAIPRLIEVAERCPDAGIRDCALNFLDDIFGKYPGMPESLDAVPMLIQQIGNLDASAVPAENAREVLEGGPEAAKALLIMRTEHPGLSIASSALACLRELWGQFPGEPRIAGSVHIMLKKMAVGDPILGLALREAIKEIGGFEPPLIPGPKIEG
ncbi:MAG: hypothetical protein AB1324_02735 [Candidatus Micrarchaeota archaeon]